MFLWPVVSVLLISVDIPSILHTYSCTYCICSSSEMAAITVKPKCYEPRKNGRLKYIFSYKRVSASIYIVDKMDERGMQISRHKYYISSLNSLFVRAILVL